MSDAKPPYGWGGALDTKPGTIMERGAFTDDSFTAGNSVWANSPIWAALCLPEKFIMFGDDFRSKLDLTNNYAVTADVGETQETIDAGGGVLSIACDGDNEDEAYVSTLRQICLFSSAKPAWFECRVKLTESNTDNANIIIGLSDTVGANFLQDAGAGPAASYDGAVFFKVDGGTVWQFETSNAGTQVTDSDVGTFTSAAWHTLGWYFDGTASTSTITPYVDGVADTARDIVLSGLQEMAVVMGVKGGNAANTVETLLVDYWRLLQVR